MRKFVFVNLVFLSLNLCAQQSLKSKGIIPEEIFSSTSNKYEIKKRASLDSSFYEPREVRLSRLRFYEQSYFMIDAIKNNANIYINDSYTKLLNKIADDLLKDEPELRSKIYLYAYRAPYVNAFSTDQGDIFFTIGLLAHVENEAELAFVVGHEIIHFIKQHNTANFNERVKVARGEGKYSGIGLDRGTEEVHSFSRDLEKEADLLSLNYYLKTEYNPKSAISALRMLRTAHLGFDEKKFNYSVLLANEMSLPTEMLPEDIPQLNDFTSYEENSTHPDIKERIKYCSKVIKSDSSSKSNNFILLSQEEFKLLRYEARIEQLVQLYDRHYYAKAIYNASLLLKEGTDSAQWLEEFIDKSFRASVKLRNQGYYTEERENSEYSGELYRVYHLLYKLNKGETATLLFLKEFNSKHDSALVKERSESALLEVIRGYKANWKNYVRAGFDTARIKSTKMDHILPRLKEVFDSEEFKENYLSLSAYFNQIEDEKDKKYDEGIKLDNDEISVKKMIIFNPYYQRLDETVQGYLDYQASYENEQKLLNAIRDASVANDIEALMLDVRELEQDQGDRFDDIALLSAYISRFAANGMDPSSKIIPASDERIAEIREKYGTDYMMWLGVRSFKGTSFKYSSSLLLNILLINFLPYNILNTFQKDHEVEMFYVIIDLKNHRIIKGDYLDVRYMKDNQNLLTVYLNAFFKNIND